eukprot:GFUD01000906.1.p1 GENE.GFUD01000906.1~~GFUD01000906.1.p1  ORF type:complete len:613 (-),score=215.60 GFUD01000906.1:166-2004(-)
MPSEFQEKLDSAWEESLPGQSSLPLADVKDMLDQVGIKLPNHKVRDIVQDLKNKGETEGEFLTKAGFEKLCQALTEEDVTKTFKTSKQHDKDAEKIEGEMGTKHTVLNEEQAAFADWINNNLEKDTDVAHKLKLNDAGSDMYEKMDDGMLLCKMINLAAPDTIDKRAINTGKNISIFKQHENLTLAINSAKAIGCVVIGIDSHTLNSSQGKKWLVLGLVWQLIKMYLFKQISISNVPGLINLLMEGEDISDLMKLSPEQLLVRWVNYQLDKAGSTRRIKNFNEDIKDSEIYTDLIAQIAPKDAGVNKFAMKKDDLTERAEMMLEQAEKIDSRAFVTARDVVRGQDKLNLAFVANLFNNHPGLDPPEEEIDIIEETREEKMYRNWMNSLGVKPRVNYLYSDLYDGLVIFQLMDFIKPGIVDWKKRVKTLEQQSKVQAKRFQEVLGNCNYAVELGKKLNFVLVGIGGSDIMEGNRTLTLALIWQLMRAYTLSLLSQLNSDGTPIVESEIINWANMKLQEGGKNISIKSFQDKSNKTALPIIHLIDVMKPGVIDFSIVNQGEKISGPDCLSNAKYCVTMARKIGAPVYALPEDISEVKHKMVMTVYASLMLADMN